MIASHSPWGTFFSAGGPLGGAASAHPKSPSGSSGPRASSPHSGKWHDFPKACISLCTSRPHFSLALSLRRAYSFIIFRSGRTAIVLFHRGAMKTPHILFLRLRAFSFPKNRQVFTQKQDARRCAIRRASRSCVSVEVLGGTLGRHGLESAPFFMP